MEYNKEHLLALLDFVKQLCGQPANEWFRAELSVIASSNSYSQDRIDTVYEICVEKIIKNNAELLYTDFVIPEIKEQLIADNIRMEHWRLRGNFEEFCMALYQQYECIVNHLAQMPQLITIFKRMLPYYAYTDGQTYDRLKDDEGGYSINKLLGIYGSEKIQTPLSGQKAIDKYKEILYFVAYGAKMKNSDYDIFNETAESVYDLYLIRCLNHRGCAPNDNERERRDRVLNRSHWYSLKYLGIYASFINRINNNYKEIDHLYQYALNLPDRVVKEIREQKKPTIVGKIDLGSIPKK